jgi:DNA-binding transcriptional MerR regulator
MNILENYRQFTGNALELSNAAVACAGQMGWAVDADKTNERLVRYYVSEGVIDRPDRQGRDAAYFYRHLLQLLTARRMVEKGMSLSVIGEHNRLSETSALEDYLHKPMLTEAELLVQAFKKPAQPPKTTSGARPFATRPQPMAIPDVLAEVQRMKDEWMKEISAVKRLRDDFQVLRQELMQNRDMIAKTQDYFHNTLQNLASVSVEREVAFMKNIAHLVENQGREIQVSSDQLNEEFQRAKDLLQKELERLHAGQEDLMSMLKSIENRFLDLKKI